MTTFFRSSRLLLFLFVLFNVTTAATSFPLHSCSSMGLSCSLSKRHDQVITADNGTMYVEDPNTDLPVPQGSASDGGGFGFDAPALIWLVWSFAVGAPLALGGIRLSRATTGASIGVVCVVLVWSAFVNTLNASGISDLLLTILAMGAFGLGFLLGLFNFGRIAGITFLGIMGGMSIGVRIILFRPGLLVPVFYVNWLIVTIIGVIGFLLVVMRQRIAITTGSAAVGTFLVGLGIDLVINRQKGMSLGLRYLFDRNNAHLVELMIDGWHPPVITEIIMAASLGAIPVLATIQHFMFKQPFKRVRSDSLASDWSDRSHRSSSGTARIPRTDPDETETLKPEESSEKSETRTSDSAREHTA